MPIIAVGVTGHRHLTEIDKIMTGVERVIQRLVATFPGTNFRVLSSLAEGADRILANRLLDIPNATLWAPLPLPQDEYLNDFEDSKSKNEFTHLLAKAERKIELPFKNIRDEAYLAAGMYIIDNCDVLLAIWDGRPARDKAGTGQIVALARKRSLPLAWIYAGNNESMPGLRVSGEIRQGTITFENFPPPGREV
ncbi:MAG: hypothetical protein ABSG01_01055 [Anaerolineales bacterium]|jgi:hypothetical protein